MTDQYGRLFAVFIFAPYLIYSGYKYKDHILIILGILLFCYECFWIYFSGPQNYYIKNNLYKYYVIYYYKYEKIFNNYNSICYITI